MADISIENIHEDLLGLKRDIAQIKHILSENYELSDEAKTMLKEARKTPTSKYVNHETIMKKFVR
jgi:hypothetical protein